MRCEYDGAGSGHIFKDGDLVEFEEDGQLVQRMVRTRTEYPAAPPEYALDPIAFVRAYVMKNGREVRILEAGKLRVVRCNSV